MPSGASGWSSVSVTAPRSNRVIAAIIANSAIAVPVTQPRVSRPTPPGSTWTPKMADNQRTPRPNPNGAPIANG